jgi:hypothetical protein
VWSGWHVRVFLASLLALAVVMSLPAVASAAKTCRAVHGSDGWKKQKITVKVQRGHVTCATARRVARNLFSNKSHYHDHGTTANSYWTIPGGWRGGFLMGNWYATKGHKRIGGLLR